LIFPRARSLFPEFRQAFRMLDEMQPAFSAFPRFEASRPAIDVQEKEDAFIFSAEVPGAKKEDLNLSFGDDGQTLTLSGKINHAFSTAPNDATSAAAIENTPSSSGGADSSTVTTTGSNNENNGMTSWVSERYSGSFLRSVRLPTPVDHNAVKASYVDGILSVTLPKKIPEGKKTIAIEWRGDGPGFTGWKPKFVYEIQKCHNHLLHIVT